MKKASMTVMTKFLLKDQDGIVCVFDGHYRDLLASFECVDPDTGTVFSFTKEDIGTLFNGGKHDGCVIKSTPNGSVIFEVEIVDFVTDKTTREQYQEYLDEFDFCSLTFNQFKHMREKGRA